MAAEELVHRAVWPFVEVVDQMDAHGRAVRAHSAKVEGERAVHGLAVLVEPSPLREATGETRQARILQRHGGELARLGERRVDAAVVEDRLVRDEVAGRRDRVGRAVLVAAWDNVDEGLDEPLLVRGYGCGRLRESWSRNRE